MDCAWEADEAPPPRRPAGSKRESVAGGRRGQDATSLQIGANARSYLMRGGEIDVFKNAEEGLVDAMQCIRIKDKQAGAGGAGRGRQLWALGCGLTCSLRRRS